MRTDSFRDRLSDGAMLLTGLAIGAGAMYIFDPKTGSGRRSAAAQKIIRGTRVSSRWLAGKSSNLANRMWGSMAELGSSLRDHSRNIPDDQLELRVRAQLGHVVSHSGLLHVRARDGNVEITGNVLPGEREKIEHRLRETRGVRKCHINVKEGPEQQRVVPMQGRLGQRQMTGT